MKTLICQNCKKEYEVVRTTTRKYCDKCKLICVKEYRCQWAILNKERKTKTDKKWISENREKWNADRRRDNLNLKIETMQAYGGLCICCKESEVKFLTLDHSNGDGYKHRRELRDKRLTGSPFYRRLRKLAFPQDLGLQVMCHNCHIAKDKYGVCPHQLAVPKQV